MAIRDDLIFHIDTGGARSIIVREVLKTNPSYDEQEIQAEIDRLVDSGELAQGELHGSPEYLVVTKFMPQTAARLRGE